MRDKYARVAYVLAGRRRPGRGDENEAAKRSVAPCCTEYMTIRPFFWPEVRFTRTVQVVHALWGGWTGPGHDSRADTGHNDRAGRRVQQSQIERIAYLRLVQGKLTAEQFRDAIAPSSRRRASAGGR